MLQIKTSNDEKDENNNLPNSKYFQQYFSTLSKNMKSISQSMLYLNISSRQKHVNNFECFLDEMKLEFDFIGITESRISKAQSSHLVTILTYQIIQLNMHLLKLLQAVSYYTLIRKHSYNIRPDLIIYKAKKFE